MIFFHLGWPNRSTGPLRNLYRLDLHIHLHREPIALGSAGLASCLNHLCRRWDGRGSYCSLLRRCSGVVWKRRRSPAMGICCPNPAGCKLFLLLFRAFIFFLRDAFDIAGLSLKSRMLTFISRVFPAAPSHGPLATPLENPGTVIPKAREALQCRDSSI